MTAWRWIEIDLDLLYANALEVKNRTKSRLLAVLKADAYGFGASACARELAKAADMFGVTTVDEGIALREAGIETPVLVMGTPLAEDLPLCLKYRLIPAIDRAETLTALAALDTPGEFHLKINTGMNRLGADIKKKFSEEFPEGSSEAFSIASLAASMSENPNRIRMSGVFSHFASAASLSSARLQLDIFNRFLLRLREAGIDPGTAHIANSAAAVLLPESRLDMVRAGTLIYGQSSVPLPEGWNIRDPFRVKARIIGTRRLKKGDPVGYGADSKAGRDLLAATAAIGYADGFTLEPQARPLSFRSVGRDFIKKTLSLIRRKPLYTISGGGRKLRVLGRVSMQLTTFDISNTNLAVGDIVEVPLRRVTASARLPRVYLKDGKPLP